MSPEHIAHLRAPVRPEQAYELVSDIRRYPDFIKYIKAIRVFDEGEAGELRTCSAEARIRYKFVAERFTTRVECHDCDLKVDVSLISGPFRELGNRWRFHALSDGSTLIDFWIRAAFRNPILQTLFDQSRARAVRSLMGQFEAEAVRRYPRIGGSEAALREEIDALVQQSKRG